MTSTSLEPSVLRRLWSLSWPTVLYSLLESMVGLIDIYLASFLGEEAMAAIGFSRQIYLVLMIGTLSITTGTITLVSQAYGGMRYESASSIATHSLLLAILSGVLLGIVGVLSAHSCLSLMGAETEALREGTAYLQVLMGGVVFLMINFTTNGIFRALGDTVTPLKVASWINALNVVFSYILLFGIGPIPRFGVMGIGLGTILARAMGAIFAIFLLTRSDRLVRIRWRVRFDWQMVRGILEIGLPAGFAGFFRNGARILFFHIVAMTSAGTVAVAVATVGFQIRMVAIMPALAFQVATATLVGQSIGAQKIDLAEAFGWTAIRFCSGLLAWISIAIFLFPDWIILFFSNSAEVIAMGRWALRFIALEQFCNSVSIIISGALSGAGDTRPAMLYTLYSQWILMLPLAYILAIYTSWDVEGAWIAWGMAPMIQVWLTYRRFQRGVWKEMRVPCMVDELIDP